MKKIIVLFCLAAVLIPLVALPTFAFSIGDEDIVDWEDWEDEETEPVSNIIPISQEPISFAEGIEVFMIFVDALWSYVVGAVSWILTPDLWILLVPFLAFLSVIAAATLRSIARGS